MAHKKKLLWGKTGEYTPLKYLESTGTQYIDTGYIPTANTSFELSGVDIDYTSGTTRFCSRVDITNENFLFTAIASDDFRFTYGSGPNTTAVQYIYSTQKLAKILSFNAATKTCTITFNDDTTESSSAFTTTPPTSSAQSIYLFAFNNNGVAVCGTSKVSALRIFEGNTLVRDMIPVLDSNGIACMLDRVENKLYYNQGTGAFLYEEWFFTPCDYVHTDGDAYINTLAYGNEDTGIESCFRSSNGRSQVVMGARTSAQSNAIVIFHPGNANTDTIVMDFGDYRVTRFNQAYFPINNWYIAHNERTKRWAKIVDSGVEYDTTTEYTDPVDTPNPIYLAYKSSGFASSNNNFIGDFKTAKVFQNGVAVRDMIPVIDDSNTAGMYDKCLNIIFYSVGTSQFEGHFVENNVDYTVVKNIIGQQVSSATNTDACPYIKTGYIPAYSKKTKLIAKFAFAHTDTSYEYFNGMNYGGRFVFGHASNNNKVYFGLGAENYTSSYVMDTDVHLYKLDWATSKAGIDDNEYTIENAGQYDQTSDFWIGARHATTYANANRPMGGTSYWWKFFDDRNLAYNGIPVIRTSDNKVGLFETIKRQFQTTAGTVEYTYTE